MASRSSLASYLDAVQAAQSLGELALLGDPPPHPQWLAGAVRICVEGRVKELRAASQLSMDATHA